MKKLIFISLVFLFYSFSNNEPGTFFTAGEREITVDSVVLRQIDSNAVYNNDFARKVFYTWTTKEQIEQLREDKKLLTREKSPTKGYAFFDLMLRDSEFVKHPVSILLQSPSFAKKRFAWPNAWATAMGFNNEKYGDRLIRIELKKDAIIIKFDPQNNTMPFTFVNLQGDSIPQEDALLLKEKIAAVYFVCSKKGKRTIKRGTYSRQPRYIMDEIPYREYVIVNENMIKAWSYNTRDVRARIMEEIKFLDFFYLHAPRKRKYWSWSKWSETYHWADNSSDPDRLYPQHVFCSSLFTMSDDYLFATRKIKKIKKKLKSVLAQEDTSISK